MNPLGGSFAGDSSNPSYQNYLAKQILSSPFAHRLHAAPRPAQQMQIPPYMPPGYPGYQMPQTHHYPQPTQLSQQQQLPETVTSEHEVADAPEQLAQPEAGDEAGDEAEKQAEEANGESAEEKEEDGEDKSEVSEADADTEGSKHETSGDGEEKTAVSAAAATGIEDVLFWSKMYDPNTAHFYYYNSKTRVSQWEKPEGFIDSDAPPPPPAWATSASSASVDYTVQATFNTQTGRFSHTGDGTYFDRVGRAPDREGRQMSAFFDLTDLQRNREEAKAKKKDLLSSSIDWRQYKEDRKKKRQKVQNKWLYNEG